MDLDFTEEQNMLRDMVRGLCEDQVPVKVVRELEDDPTGYREGLWKKMAELGLLGLMLPEKYGGAAQSAIEGALLYEEFGRSLAPSPHFPSCVLGGGALVVGGSEDQKQAWLPKIISGDAILTPAWLEPKNGFGPNGVQMKAVAGQGGFRLTGTKLHVPFASSASRLLVLARTGDADTDVDLFLVDPSAPGIKTRQMLNLASEPQYEVTFNDVAVSAADRIGAARSGWATWNQVMHDGIIFLAAQAAGGADRALEITVEYAKVRQQFDKPIGSFQAISHYLADATTNIDGAKTLVYEAAWARSAGRPIQRLAPMAKLYACQTYRDAAAIFVQIHGGYGFTVEYDIQLYFRRAKQMQLSWWDTRYLEELIASDVLDGQQ
jgi:alkylation response protein AidB-like acyl-CoA dehydrogenase